MGEPYIQYQYVTLVWNQFFWYRHWPSNVYWFSLVHMYNMCTHNNWIPCNTRGLYKTMTLLIALSTSKVVCCLLFYMVYYFLLYFVVYLYDLYIYLIKILGLRRNSGEGARVYTENIAQYLYKICTWVPKGKEKFKLFQLSNIPYDLSCSFSYAGMPWLKIKSKKNLINKFLL